MMTDQIAGDDRMKSPPWLGPVGLTALLLALWWVVLRAMNPGLMADDSGETVAAAVGLGIPHPPGYPLLTLVGRLVSLVPLGTPAFRLNLLAAVFTLLAILFVVKAGLHLLHRDSQRPAIWMAAGVTVLAVLSGLSCRSLFAQSLTAKGGIYTMTLLFSAVLLWWRIRGEEPETSSEAASFRFLALLTFFWSVGLSNHWETQLCWLPFLIVWGRTRRSALSPKTTALLLSFLLVGCSLYLAIPLRARFFPYVDWGHAVNLKRLLWVMARGPYLGIEVEARPLYSYVGKAGVYLRHAGIHWWPGWALLAGYGFAVLVRERRRLALELALFYAPVVLAVLVVPNMKPDAYFLIYAYLVATQAVPVLLGFYGSWRLLSSIGRRPWIAMTALAVLLAVSGLWFSRTVGREGREGYTHADDFAVNILKGLPKDALILSEGDQFVMTLFYYQGARGIRRDVRHVPAIFLASDWGVELAMHQLPANLQPEFPLISPRERVRFLVLAFERLPDPQAMPTYYSLNRGFYDELGLGLEERLVVTGLSYRVISGKGPSAESIAESVWETAHRQRMRRVPVFREKGQYDFATEDFFRYYANQYVVTGNTLNHAGFLTDAHEFYLKALEVYPFAAEAYSNMAVLYGKEGYLEIAQVLCQMANEKDPNYAGAYDNLGNVYALMGSYKRAVEAYRRALTLKPDEAGTRKNLAQSEEYLRMRAPPPKWELHPSTFYFSLGNRNADEGRLLMAEIAYKTAETFGYTYPDLYNNLGVVMARQQKDAEAETAFQNALERKEDFVEVYKNYGLLLINQGRVRQARRIIGKGLNLDPQNPELLSLEGMLR